MTEAQGKQSDETAELSVRSIELSRVGVSKETDMVAIMSPGLIILPHL
jgi:hypothetical protein